MNRFEKVDFNKVPIITTYAERADETYRGFFHYHQGIELLFVHEGTGIINVNQKSYSLQPNSMYIFQPFQLHRVTVQHPKFYVRSMFHFDPLYLEKKLDIFPNLKHFLDLLWKLKLTEHCYQNLDFFQPVKININQTKQHGNFKEEEDALLLLIQILHGLRKSLNLSNLTSTQRWNI